MAKGIIKLPTSTPTPITTKITVDAGTNPPVEGTTKYDGTTPVGAIVVGQITDSQSGAVIDFQQPFGAEIGLVDGAKVNYNVVTVNGKQVANYVKLLERGVIETINATNDGGTLKDRATKTIIPFNQLYCSESGFIAPSQGIKGSNVSFERVIDPLTAGYVAVCLELKP